MIVRGAEEFEVLALNNRMLDELAADPRFLPSAFWRDINDKNIRMLLESGIANFKKTVAQNYFNWLITNPLHPLFLHLARDWIAQPSLRPFQTIIEPAPTFRLTTASAPVSLTFLQRHVYRLYVALLWHKMLRLDAHGLNRRVLEPELGNPIHVWQGQKLISQDLANSIMECNSIVDCLHSVTTRRARVAEVGAGYGRLAHVFSQTQNGTYFIFDVPPALCISDWYLTRLVPEKQIFRFRSFKSFDTVRDEIEASDVVLLTANQLALVPPDYFDVVVSISSLPEMTMEQANMYLRLFQRVSGGAIFLKQWKAWTNPHDGTNLRADDYELGPDWNLVTDQTDPVNPRFFNRIWKRRPK